MTGSVASRSSAGSTPTVDSVIRRGDIAVRLYGEVAVLRYRAQLELVFGGHKIPLSDYWHTDTYEKHEGRWMVVWSQATAIR